jgi:hypothetical protein
VHVLWTIHRLEIGDLARIERPTLHQVKVSLCRRSDRSMADHGDHKKPAMKRQVGQRMREQLREEDDSEATLLSNIEKRSHGNATHGDGFQPAVFGERAPLGEAALDVAFGRADSAPAAMQGKGKMDFKTMAQRVLNSQRSAKSKRNLSDENHGHRRVATLLASIDESNRDNSESNKLRNDSMDIGDWGALISQDVHEHIDEERHHPLSSSSIDDVIQAPPHHPESESLPLLNPTERYDGVSSTATARRRRAAAARGKQFWKNFRDCMNPIRWMRRIIYLFFHSFLVLAFPCFAVAWVLYYHLGNPKFDFMPGQATLSWWLNFFGA